MTFSTSVNGEPRDLELSGREVAVDVLREQLGLTGTKLVCGGGVCGACTIRIDGVPAAGCLTPAVAMVDAEVTTVEGIAVGDELHPVQNAFLAHDGLQCGYCTPGFIVNGVAFYERWRAEHGDDAPRPTPDRHTIADAFSGHLCRCGAYEGINRAIAAACRGDFDVDAAAGPSVEPARIDAPAKVTGRAVYTADVYPDDVLHAVIVRSPIAAADVGPLPSPASGAPEWIVDLAPEDRRVRWAGQPLFAVAAESLTEARRLAAELSFDLTPRPYVIDPARALEPGAPPVYEDRAARKLAPNAAEGPMLPTRWSGNRRGPTPTPFLGTLAKRRIRNAGEADESGLVELQLGTETQLHTSFEPHGTVADWSDPNLLRVWTSTQAVEQVRHDLIERFELRADQVEITADFVGGGFGSKLAVSPDVIGAVELSRLARRPVRLILDRREELTATGNRPGSRTDVSLLVSGDGDIEALVVDAESHGGTAVNGVYGALCMLVYDRSPRLARDSDVVTNTPPGSPFRGPGGPTYAWALEQAVDQAAHQLGWDPIELRQRWDGNEKRQALYTWARELDVWTGRPATGSQTGRFRRGVGVAAANWLYMHDPTTEIEVGVESGRLVVTTATQDIGTGSKTLLARAVGGVFDVAPTEVVVRLGRSADGVPHGPTSGGSRVTPSLWPTAVEAAELLRDEVGTDLAAVPDGTSVSSGRAPDGGNRLLRLTMGDLQVGRGFSAAVHVSEVEVDTRTGKTRVLTVHGGLAIGTPFVPALATSQCEGSIIQGIGLALYENQVLDPHTGLTLTSNLEDYRIPQLGDGPEITIHFHTGGWEHVAGGGVGLGEVGTISPAASVGNAIFNATGWRPTVAPVRPDRLLDGMARRPAMAKAGPAASGAVSTTGGGSGRPSAATGHSARNETAQSGPTSITFLHSAADPDLPAGSVVRAGGTDLQERLRSANSRVDIVDLTRIPGFTDIATGPDGGVRIGAGATIAAVARELSASHPALALTAAGLATPQIRNVATIGGNLVQRTRCWYYRHPDLDCFKSGGDSCPARTGRHLYGVVFDRSGCVHPHPSSIAMALLVYDATVSLSDGSELPVADLLGDGVDPTSDHHLPDGVLLAAVNVPAAMAGEAGAYFRSISRFEAEWPLVEAVVRARRSANGTVGGVALALGGVATVPLRMTGPEQLLDGRRLDDAVIAEVAEACAAGANPLPETGYKVELVRATVTETLERLRAAG